MADLAVSLRARREIIGHRFVSLHCYYSTRHCNANSERGRALAVHIADCITKLNDVHEQHELSAISSETFCTHVDCISRNIEKLYIHYPASVLSATDSLRLRHRQEEFCLIPPLSTDTDPTFHFWLFPCPCGYSDRSCHSPQQYTVVEYSFLRCGLR